MQEDLHHPVAVLVEIGLVVLHLLHPLLDELVLTLPRDSLRHVVAVLQMMDLRGDYVLVVGAVEDRNLPSCGERLVDAPEVVVGELLLGGLFKARDMHALGVEAGCDLPDQGVLSRSIERLQHDDNSLPPVRVEHVLEGIELFEVLLKGLCDLLPGDAILPGIRWEPGEIALFAPVKPISVRLHGPDSFPPDLLLFPSVYSIFPRFRQTTGVICHFDGFSGAFSVPTLRTSVVH